MRAEEVGAGTGFNRAGTPGGGRGDEKEGEGSCQSLVNV